MLKKIPARVWMLSALYTTFLLSVSTTAHARAIVGGSMSSVFAGRPTPGLNIGFMGKSFGMTFYTSGVRTTHYFHSAYLLDAFWLWKPGDFGWGDIIAGFGGGLYFGNRGYRHTRTSDIHPSQDIDVGPAIRVAWYFAGPVFVAVETMFGVRNIIQPALFFFQDVSHVSLGVEI